MSNNKTFMVGVVSFEDEEGEYGAMIAQKILEATFLNKTAEAVIESGQSIDLLLDEHGDEIPISFSLVHRRGGFSETQAINIVAMLIDMVDEIDEDQRKHKDYIVRAIPEGVKND